jgi:hypothetical protein
MSQTTDKSPRTLACAVQSFIQRLTPQKKRSYYKSAEMQISAYGAAYNQDARRPQITQGLIVVAYSWREPDLIKLDANDLCNRVSQFGERLSTFKILEPELYA